MSKRVMMVVGKGCFNPLNESSVQMLRDRGLKVGDIVAVSFTKPRNPEFWRMAHQLGTLCVENIDDFHGIDSHAALKKLQFDGNIECEESMTVIPEYGMEIKHRKPKSLAFESMDQTVFYQVMRQMSAFIVKKYWPNLTEDQVLKMIDCLVTE
jgi:hypothetical protein